MNKCMHVAQRPQPQPSIKVPRNHLTLLIEAFSLRRHLTTKILPHHTRRADAHIARSPRQCGAQQRGQHISAVTIETSTAFLGPVRSAVPIHALPHYYPSRDCWRAMTSAKGRGEVDSFPNSPLETSGAFPPTAHAPIFTLRSPRFPPRTQTRNSARLRRHATCIRTTDPSSNVPGRSTSSSSPSPHTRPFSPPGPPHRVVCFQRKEGGSEARGV
ncbi:hypothetical protein M427DRAFT_247198 [Gonapodya prolifera JEL478]|uniref:Uncharacterized protein n=1 Tax=Gonapodya prolifera (strain JEL478) TaxID=1344416 RepID=A0A139AM34_GONPJ|nr:hypothetical protein M427DRAFT_247198 [Gonapodya prolifera JEL478]|eukprot:KXS17836.1 hypothetical protein M427DRAFT_247198 [Gonapodya prolifera JEL478]